MPRVDSAMISPIPEILFLVACAADILAFCIIWGKATGRTNMRWGSCFAIAAFLFTVSLLFFAVIWDMGMIG